jgi:hypothetical protein
MVISNAEPLYGRSCAIKLSGQPVTTPFSVSRPGCTVTIHKKREDLPHKEDLLPALLSEMFYSQATAGLKLVAALPPIR